MLNSQCENQKTNNDMETTNKQMTAEELTQLVESTSRWGINSITDRNCNPKTTVLFCRFIHI